MKITEKELYKIAHSLGINIYHSKKSKYKKDKKLPKEFYRNYYCTSGLDDFKNLIESNIMEVFKTDENYHYLGVTDYGIELFRKEFNTYVNDIYVCDVCGIEFKKIDLVNDYNICEKCSENNLSNMKYLKMFDEKNLPKIKILKDITFGEEEYKITFKKDEIVYVDEPYSCFNDDGTFTVCCGMNEYYILQKDYFVII